MLCAVTRAPKQQEEFVRQHFRISERGRSAQLHETLALRALERFDHTPRRMVLFGEFDGGIRQWTPAFVSAGNVGGHVLKPSSKLLGWISRMVGFELVPRRLGLFRQSPEVSRNQIVL
jgi:hypothetical protein